jgi:hypothetical protein
LSQTYFGVSAGGLPTMEASSRTTTPPLGSGFPVEQSLSARLHRVGDRVPCDEGNHDPSGLTGNAPIAGRRDAAVIVRLAGTNSTKS